jgi:diguanylate cyclase (GGDEF)-like protein/PAS domain S-box-containing protein
MNMTKEVKFHKLQSIKIKFPLYISALCIVVSLILAVIFTQKSLADLKTEYEKRSTSIALNISSEMKYGLLTEDFEVIEKIIIPQFKQPDILYIAVVNSEGKKLVEKFKQPLSKEIDHKLNSWALSMDKPAVYYAQDSFKDQSLIVTQEFIEAVAPVYVHTKLLSFDEVELLPNDDLRGEKLGVIRVGLSLASLASERIIMVKFAIIIIIVVMLLSSIVAYFMARIIIKPLLDISKMASRVTNGDLDGMQINAAQNKMSFSDSPQTLEIYRGDEIGYLTSNFIRMSKRIKEHHSELEAKVIQRTNELTNSLKASKTLKYQAETVSDELLMVNKTLMLYRHSIESTSDCILITDNVGHIIIINPAFTGLSDYSIAELEGQTIDFIVAPQELKMFKEEVSLALASHGEWSGQTFFYKKGGTTYPVELSITAIQDEQQNTIANVLISRDITLRTKYESELKQLADHDPLTGLFNRRRFQEELELALLRSHRQQTKVALVWIDLDQFKEVNDSLGHLAGDTLLCNVAEALLEASRGDEIVARMGGDEFAMIMSIKSEEQALQGAERIINQVRQSSIIINNAPIRVTSSIGVAIYPDHANDSATLLAHADIALYKSKSAGRNKFSLYQPLDEENTYATEHIHWKQKIWDALENNKLLFYAQAIIDTKTGRACHYELLLRIQGDNGEIILPGAFISQAERIGVIRDIDRWVVINAIKLLSTVKEKGYSISCAINLSAQTLNEHSFTQLIHEQLNSMNVESHLLMLEITESAAISDINNAQRFIKTLSEIGCQFALDDFGAGFSSFSYLKNLKVNYLKLDGSFIHNLPNEPRDLCIVEGMIKVANGLDMKIIAEWVENQETLDILTNLGVDQVQGFHISKPIPIDKLFEVLSLAGKSIAG